jgi:hypothetical protein
MGELFFVKAPQRFFGSSKFSRRAEERKHFSREILPPEIESATPFAYFRYNMCRSRTGAGSKIKEAPCL